MEGNRKSDEHKFSSEHRRVSSKASGGAGDHLEGRGSPGGSHCENLALELVKSFNPNRREIRVPEYRRGIKDLNTTQWRRGPISHTAKLVNKFGRLDSTSAKELERGLPTGSRL